MKKLVTILIVLALACTPALADDPNFTRVYENGKGAVTFNHENHARVSGTCANCHDQLKEFGGEVNKKFAHAVCKSCHKDVRAMKPTAPTKCNGCHVK
jgi:hypothetical protein